ncbi:MAG: CsbD family protein [Ramlibacter sp.]|jgi:uncharacterized protein YjbJ (UPF0337 family)|uniref:CsbD family protein n=1 Tax=Ramlibacter sp. TaxID=1917967 RepID=UPI00260637AC|nr:CsbD family protein [Ramlibacter sp.]MDB5753037.1 CsbD family protein [Ramlibacter sp.]
MNQDRIQGRWKQLKGKVREQWGKLTDDDIDVIDGRRDQLLGRIQQRHGQASQAGPGEAPGFAGAGPAAGLRFDDGGETVGGPAPDKSP